MLQTRLHPRGLERKLLDIEANSPLPPERNKDMLEALFIDGLKDLYSAENQLLRALPKLVKSVSSEHLQQVLLSHLEVTMGQVARLTWFGNWLAKALPARCV